MNSYNKSEELLEVPIRASLWKSVLLAGADRRLTITVIGSCMVLVLLSRFSLWPCVTALTLATVGQLIGIKLAAVDPQIIDIYLRHIGYSRLYSARADYSTPWCKPRPTVPKV